MVSSFEVRTLCPSISFLYVHLGASLRISHTFCPLVEGFVCEENSLNLVLADLFPLLRQSVDWFEDLVGDRRVMLEVRSSELEMGLSYNDEPIEENTTTSTPRVVKAFSALEEECGLDVETFPVLGIGFNFLRGLRFVFLTKRNELATFHLERCASIRLPSKAGLGFPSTPLSWCF